MRLVGQTLRLGCAALVQEAEGKGLASGRCGGARALVAGGAGGDVEESVETVG